MGSRRGWAIAVAAPLVGLALAPAAVSAGPTTCAATGVCHFTVLHPAKESFMDGPADNHPVSLEYDVYIPENADAAMPQPGIVHFNGLGGSKGDAAAILTSGLMASHGYVVLAYTSQGNGHSSGVLELDSPDYDGKDARHMIGLLAARSDVLKINGDPQIGLTGGSYGGAIQETVAEFDPRVKVITPWRTFASADYTLSPNNLGLGYDFQSQPIGVLKHGNGYAGWLDLIFAQGATFPARGMGGGSPTDACPGWDPGVCSLYANAVANGKADDAGVAFVRKLSGLTYLDPAAGRPGLRVPTMLVQGEHDTLFNENEAIAIYTSLKARGVPVEMIWQYGGHGYDGPQTGGGTNEGDLQGDLNAQGADPHDPQAYGRKYLPRRIVAWMDHYLRKTGEPTGPEFSYYRDWIQYDHHADATPAFGDTASYPAQQSVKLGLGTSNDLLGPGQPSPAGTVQVLLPLNGVPASYSETPNFQAPDTNDLSGNFPSPFRNIPATDVPGEVATFTSAPFARDTVSVGGPTVHLKVQSTTGQSDVVLFCKVFDVDGSGNAVMLPRGPAASRIPLTGSQPTTADIKCLPLAHLFAAGHSVRLVLAATDNAMSSHRAPDVITLATGGADAATFSLPVDSVAGPLLSSRLLPNSAPGADPRLLAAPLLLLLLTLASARGTPSGSQSCVAPTS